MKKTHSKNPNDFKPVKKGVESLFKMLYINCGELLMNFLLVERRFSSRGFQQGKMLFNQRVKTVIQKSTGPTVTTSYI
jgi:hypothetical protein